MGRISVNNLREGMLLEDDLCAPNGRIILGKGAVLKEKYISMFKIWGITGADVEGAEDSEILHQARLRDEAVRQGESYVASYFPPAAEEDGHLSEVRAYCVRRCAEKIEEGKPPEPLPLRSTPPRPPRGHFGRTFSARSLARNEVRLVSFPDIYFKIQDVINSPLSSATSIARVVSNDPNLTARLLRLVNSSFYGFPQPILSIPRAIAIVGSNELTSLALAVSTDGAPGNVLEDVRLITQRNVRGGVQTTTEGARR